MIASELAQRSYPLPSRRAFVEGAIQPELTINWPDRSGSLAAGPIPVWSDVRSRGEVILVDEAAQMVVSPYSTRMAMMT